jgi:hypothetical protein
MDGVRHDRGDFRRAPGPDDRCGLSAAVTGSGFIGVTWLGADYHTIVADDGFKGRKILSLHMRTPE